MPIDSLLSVEISIGSLVSFAFICKKNSYQKNGLFHVCRLDCFVISTLNIAHRLSKVSALFSFNQLPHTRRKV